MLDYAIWDLKKRFLVEDAAYLWFGFAPLEKNISQEDTQKIEGIRSVLQEARQEGEIETVYDKGPLGEDILDFPKVTREGLRAYAEKIGQKPLFLFPGERKSCDTRKGLNKQGARTKPDVVPFLTSKAAHDPKARAKVSKNSKSPADDVNALATEDQSTEKPFRRLEIPEAAERRYSKLDLYELGRLVISSFNPYPFVRAVYLCPGEEPNRPYSLLFEVPEVPEDMTDLHKEFMKDLSDGPEYFLDLRRVYRDPKRTSIDEWIWYDVKDAKDVVGEGLYRLVLSGEFVCLLSRDDDEAKQDQAQKGEGKLESGVERKELKPENLFHTGGDFWDIAFEGSEIFHVKDSIGLKYIHLLLGRPGDPISAFEMAKMGRWEQNPDSAEYDGMTSDQLEAQGMRKANLDNSNKQRVENEQARARDEQARAACEARLEEIEREIQESANDPAKVSELSEQWNMISEELGTTKPKTNPRSAVTMAINRAIKQINEYLPALAEYLDQTIETGETCTYHPLIEKPIDWKF